ncbi:phage tail tape measure protein [Mesorhizobium sp. PUT5]|uniref:phage tail tape measure protein n=1 Tax=Mesorhizobium sp. PUT5 TaxID=3454629 RepID=UPI003FA4288E
MADDTERLVVLLEARMRDFENNMLKAAGISQRNFNAIKRNSKSASAQMEADWARTTRRINEALASSSLKIGAYAKAFGGGFLGGALGGGLVTTLGRISRGVAEVGDAAKRAGLDFKTFQELSFVAKQNRIEVNALTDGMKELLSRADKFVETGAGSGAEAFRRLGLNAKDLAKKLKDPSALFTEIIGKLQRFDRAAQLRISTELFGRLPGEQFIGLVERGADGIQAQIAAARKLGLVLDDDVIRRAQEIDRKFGEIGDSIAGWVQPKVIAFLDDVLALIDRMKPTAAQSDDTLDQKLADIGERRLEIENQILRLQNEQRDAAKNWNPFAMVDNDQAIKDLREENEELAEQEKRILAIVAARQQLTTTDNRATFRDVENASMEAYRSMKEQTDAFIKEAQRRAALTKEQLALETEIAKVRNDALKEGVNLTEKQIEAIARANIEGEKARNTTAKESDYQRLTKRIQEATAAQVAQTEAMRGVNPLIEDYGYAVERARVEFDLLNAAQKEGLEITPELAAEIERMADAYASAAAGSRQLADEQEKVRREAEESASIIREAIGGALEDVFLGGMSSSDKFFDHLMKSLAGIGKEFARLGMNKFMDSITGKGTTSFLGGSASVGGGASVVNANIVGREVGRAMAQPISDRFSSIGNDLADNIRVAANTLGVSARDLATVISYETGGTFSTSIRGGAGGRHIGLIQFGPEEQRKYGAAIGQALNDQMQAVVGYLKDRGLKPGMDLLDLYSTINAGRPGLYNRSDAANGGAPGTVYDKVTGQMAGHQANADRILSTSVKDGVVAGIRQTAAAAAPANVPAAAGPSVMGGMTRMEGFMGVGGAALGAFANGYSSGDPLMGGISGAFSGFGAAGAIGAAFPALAGIAGPVGIIGGAIVGPCGGRLAKAKKKGTGI